VSHQHRFPITQDHHFLQAREKKRRWKRRNIPRHIGTHVKSSSHEIILLMRKKKVDVLVAGRYRERHRAYKGYGWKWLVGRR
jgi:hypothetical protein